MRRLSCVLTFALAVACGSGRGAAADDAVQPRPTAVASRNLVTAEELQRLGGNDLLEAVRALRPTWFRQSPTSLSRGGVTMDAVVVYVDGRRLGPPSTLRDIALHRVLEVRFYSPSEAQGRFGLGNLQGAIEVVMLR